MATPDTAITLINSAVRSGDVEKVRAVLNNDSKCIINCTDTSGLTPLHYACMEGNLYMVRALILEFKADINALNCENNTPLHVAALGGKEEVVYVLIEEFDCDTSVKGTLGRSLVHSACNGGSVNLVRTLILKHKADINARDDQNDTPIHVAAFYGKEEVVYVLIEEFDCDTSIKDGCGHSLLHNVCYGGSVNLARMLILTHNADINARDDENNTPLLVAALGGKEEVVSVLIEEFDCDISVKGGFGRFLLHNVCIGGSVNLVRTFILKHKADINARDDENNTPLLVAALGGKEEVVSVLIEEFDCDISVKGGFGRSLLHSACNGGSVNLVKTLILKHKADINARDDENDTPLLVAALGGKEEVVSVLIEEFDCDISVKGGSGQSLLHNACYGDSADLVRTLILKHRADINARDDQNNTPLHVAALCGKEEVISVLIEEFDCEINVKGWLGQSILHKACTGGNVNLVKALVLKHKILTLMVDRDGDTPLHLCAATSNMECLKALLFCNAPIMIRNNSGKTSRDVATAECRSVIDAYIESSKENIHLQYAVFQQCAKEKYSSAERITRIFVIGNPGAGKSTLVETLKREGFFDTFRRVTVPPHTAGIVPSIHTSKHYGRVVFYDFAGDPEYYSSHAAILENLVSLRNGDNIFVIVADLRKGFDESRLALCYWFSFIQHQKFGVRKPSLFLIGSHLDQISSSRIEEGRTLFEGLHENFNLYMKLSYFMLDCCKPKSNKIARVQREIARITQDSPCHKLSLHASILLGLLEKDFSNVTAISVTKLQSHITDTGVQLPTEIHFLRSILLELHELGFVFIVDGNHLQFVLNISRLTNIVHKSLFSEESRKTLTAMCETHGTPTSMKIGIIPRSVLEKILPENITVECLVQLQYCQQISHTDVGAFPSIADSNSTSQSFLFFPALCSADKSDMSWVTPPNLSYSIGWLARCIGSRDYFPPRFLHVLLLRLVFRFALTPNQAPGADPDHSCFQRHCTMWKTGVHWPMEEGVECMVELASQNREVVVILKSEEDTIENCISVFNSVISCVMEAKAEFCHSNKLDFFLIDPTEDSNYLAEDNLFAMSAVERVLVEGKEVVHSVNLKRRMRRTEIMCLLKLTHWYSLFPMDFNTLLDHLCSIVSGLYDLGRYLGISCGLLDAIEADFPTDTSSRRRKLVRAWLNSSLDPPCWWHLVQALNRIDERVLAKKIAGENSELEICSSDAWPTVKCGLDSRTRGLTDSS